MRSQNLSALMDKRYQKVHVLAKMSMMNLLAKWDKNITMEVIKTKDKRYREADNEKMQTLVGIVGIINSTDKYAKSFIQSRKWAIEANESPMKSLPKQDISSSDAETIS